jgi:hypothetical protein
LADSEGKMLDVYGALTHVSGRKGTPTMNITAGANCRAMDIRHPSYVPVLEVQCDTRYPTL